jgi:cytidine deaminase
VSYEPAPIKLSKLISQVPGFEELADIRAEDERIRQSMSAGNIIRRKIGHADTVARLALSDIQTKRASLNESQDVTVPAEGHAFIITSLKRSEELEMPRKLFGQRAILISIYEPKDHRIENLCRRIASSKGSSDPELHRDMAIDLIKTDQKERSDKFGQ